MRAEEWRPVPGFEELVLEAEEDEEIRRVKGSDVEAHEPAEVRDAG